MTKSKRMCHLTTPESRKDVIIPGRNVYYWRFARGRCLGYASHAAMAGIPLTVIAKQLGHRDTLMVERHYSHLGSSFVDEIIQKKMPTLVSRK